MNEYRRERTELSPSCPQLCPLVWSLSALSALRDVWVCHGYRYVQRLVMGVLGLELSEARGTVRRYVATHEDVDRQLYFHPVLLETLYQRARSTLRLDEFLTRLTRLSYAYVMLLLNARKKPAVYAQLRIGAHPTGLLMWPASQVLLEKLHKSDGRYTWDDYAQEVRPSSSRIQTSRPNSPQPEDAFDGLHGSRTWMTGQGRERQSDASGRVAQGECRQAAQGGCQVQGLPRAV